MRLRHATEADTEQLIEWMRALWQTDTEPFNEVLSRQGLAELLASQELGRIWIVEDAGYLILTFGFSLEFGGRDAFIDEFYLSPAIRGQGIGTAALERVAHEAASLGIKALHLEVADTNGRAEAFYRRQRFHLHSRRLMTRWL